MTGTEGTQRQLISYIALSAPATRRPAEGNEPFLRPEIGFTPRWYHTFAAVDLGERWHSDPAHRREAIAAMGREVRRRFGSVPIGPLQNPVQPLDLLTGTFGTSFVPSLYGVPIAFQTDNWPWSAHQHLNDEQAGHLEPPDLDSSAFFADFMAQLEWIEKESGRIEGYINWQGVLNSAYRLRGEELFVDMVLEPERARRVFECVTTSIIDGTRRLYERQSKTGVERHHVTVSNCLVNLVSPDQYRDLLFPCDRRIAEAFEWIGVHNCAWNADPYLPHYKRLPHVGYVDMGIESDLEGAREAFPEARRALMYTPMDVANKSPEQIRSDLERIARDYGPCDIVFADIEAGTPDERVLDLVRFCEEISERHAVETGG